MINSLKTGINAYYADYGTYPYNTSGSVALTDLYNSMVGNATGGTSPLGNTRQIAYMEFAQKDLSDPTKPPVTIIDPWYKAMKSNAAQNYQVYVDSAYMNSITISSGPASGTLVNAGVAIWDPGMPSKGKVNTTNTATMIQSW